MNSLERAQRFLAEKASRLALSVLPLAALAVSAVPAHANTTFNVGSGSGLGNCSAFSSSGSASCNSFQQNSVGGDPNANWVAMGGSGSMVSFSGGSMSFGISGGGASGSLGAGTVPVSWDFFLTNRSSSGGTVNWDVFFEVSFSGGEFPNYSLSGSTVLSGSGTTEVTGSNAITIPGGNVTGYEINLFTVSSGGSAIPFSVDIPGDSSLDLNTGVPEPSSLLLVAAGGLLFLRRKKRK